MAKPYNHTVKPSVSNNSLSKLANSFAKEASDENDVKDIITFLEAPWGLNLNESTQPLFPAQKFILKLYYKIPLETETKTILIRDKFNERELYHFTEKEYLEHLYNQGRCNINYLDDKPRNELVLIVGRRGSKCLENNSLITTTEGTLTAKELLSRLQNKERIGIFTYDKETYKKYITYKIKAEDNGIKPVVKLTTSYGRTEDITTEHPYFIWRDSWLEPQWVKAEDLLVGDPIAVSKSQELFGNTSIGKNKAKLLGYLQGDGGLTKGVCFTNTFKNSISEIHEIITAEYPNHIIKPRRGSNYGYVLRSYDKCKQSDKNKILKWLREIQVHGKLSKHKTIPDCIKKAPKEEIALFLNRLYSCDGFVSIDKPDKSHKLPKCNIAIALASEKFIIEIQRELLKFGIISNYRKQLSDCNGKKFDSWKLEITSSESIIKFIDEISIFNKEDKLKIARSISIRKSTTKLKLQYLPQGSWNRVLKTKKEKNLTDTFIHGESPYGNTRLRKQYKLCKEKARIYSKNIGDTYLYTLATSDIYWDTVKSIKNLGLKETVALEVEDTNIIGNDIISHNSSLASWIAAYETYKLLKIPHPQKHYGLLPDAEIHLTTLATSEDQANLLFRQILGHFSQSNYFHRFLNKPTADRVSIRSRRDLEKYGEEGKTSIMVKSAPCSARAARGPGNIVVIMDEQAHFVDENAESNKSDIAVYEAVTPSVATFKGDGKIINISSPLNKSGMLWDLYNKALTGDSNLLMIQAPSWEINNTLDSTYLKGRYHNNPITYECEFGGNFSDRVSSWMPEEYLRRIIIPDLKEKTAGTARVPHFMGLDIGFKEDGTSIAVSHIVTVKDEETGDNINKIEIDYVDSRSAGIHPYEKLEVLDFELLADWIAEICNKFFIVKGMVDQHNGMLVTQNLAKRGLHQFDLAYHTRQFNSDLYQNFMMLCIDKKLRLYNNKTVEYNDSDLIQELLRLQVVQHSKNVISVESPKLKGQHDDRSDALVRSVWLATEALKSGATGSMSLSNNRFGYVRDANHYQLMKSRIHNITDNRRSVRNLRRNAWVKKNG